MIFVALLASYFNKKSDTCRYDLSIFWITACFIRDDVHVMEGDFKWKESYFVRLLFWRICSDLQECSAEHKFYEMYFDEYFVQKMHAYPISCKPLSFRYHNTLE